MSQDWASALRRLTREAPSGSIQQAVLDAMRSNMTDRAVALVSAAFVDTMLAGAIIRVLNPNQKGIRELFWSPNGPFSSFDQRIVGVSAINLIGGVTRKNLDVIKNIRNVFAHAMADVEFSSPAISRACDRLQLSSNAQFFVDQEQNCKNKYKYCYACNTIFKVLFSDFGGAWLTGRLGTSRAAPILP
jgi:hypothetical protein